MIAGIDRTITDVIAFDLSIQEVTSRRHPLNLEAKVITREGGRVKRNIAVTAGSELTRIRVKEAEKMKQENGMNIRRLVFIDV